MLSLPNGSRARWFGIKKALAPAGRGRGPAGGWEGERLSGLSSCIGEISARIASFGVEDDEQLSGEGDADDLQWFSGLAELGAEGGEDRLVAADEFGDDEEDLARA